MQNDTFLPREPNTEKSVNINGRSVQVFLTSLPFGMYQFSVGSTNNVNFGAN